MELDFLKRLAYLLYGSVASLLSPSSNIEAWPIWHVAPRRFAPAFRALGVCEHSWLRYNNLERNLSKMGRNLCGTKSVTPVWTLQVKKLPKFFDIFQNSRNSRLEQAKIV